MIEHMRSYFVAAGHLEVSSSSFAHAMLRTTKVEILRQVERVGFVPAAAAAMLLVELGDHAAPKGRAIAAYVNASEWKAKCECGGCEFVDFDEPVFMCCSCWNAADGHEWRPVVVPGDEIHGDAVSTAFATEMLSTSADGELVALPSPRERIEALLLARGDPLTRNWKPGETLDDLTAENAEHGVVS